MRSGDDDIPRGREHSFDIVSGEARAICVYDQDRRAETTQGGVDGAIQTRSLVPPDLDAGRSVEIARGERDHAQARVQDDPDDVLEERFHEAHARAAVEHVCEATLGRRSDANGDERGRQHC